MLNKVYYGGELIESIKDKPSKDRQWWLLDNHPIFTGKCARCDYQFPLNTQKNWTCPECGCTHEQ